MIRKCVHLLAGGFGSLALMLVIVVGTSQAEETINVYAWQNWSFEIVDTDGSRKYTRLQNNAANIGFSAQVDSGLDGIQVGFRCEQYTFFAGAAANAGPTNRQWCTRNSKLSLIHETAGELMIGTWLLPYNEIVAQWVSQGYDADNTGHTALMGDFGSGGIGDGYYSPGFGLYGVASFERRQENIIQYVWPNLADANSQTREGFQFRAAITDGKESDSQFSLVSVIDGSITTSTETVDPYIFSSGVSYQTNVANGGQVWLAFAYEKHEDWAVNQIAENAFLSTGKRLAYCAGSDGEGYRLAGRYIQPWAGTGQKSSISVIWETLEFELSGCDNVDFSRTISGFPNKTTDLLIRDNPVLVPAGTGTDLNLDKDTWLIYGTHNFGNGFDIRATYSDTDKLDYKLLGLDAGSGSLVDTDAQFFSAGVYYTAPAGTEFRITYAEIDNGANAQYDFGNGPAGAGQGQDPEIVSFGIIQWFD